MHNKRSWLIALLGAVLCGIATGATACDTHTHVYEEIPAVAATCLQTGLTAGLRCSTCGKIIVEQTETPLGDHTFDDTEWTVITPATCANEGVSSHVCSVCGKVIEVATEKLPHAHIVVDEAVTATLTESGLTEGSHCTDCGEIVTPQTPTYVEGLYIRPDKTFTLAYPASGLPSLTITVDEDATGLDLAGIITLATDGATWNLYADQSCTNRIDTLLPLEIGANICYLRATKGTDAITYRVTVNRPTLVSLTLVNLGEEQTIAVDSNGYVTELPSPDNTEKGYTFGGWSKTENGTPITFPCKITSATTLYAVNTPIVYHITYILNGCSKTSSMPDTYTVEDEFELPVPTVFGYTGISWAPDNRHYKGMTGDMTYTAILMINTYHLTYDANGGTMPSDVRTTYTVEDSFTLPVPTKEGYTFDGWSSLGYSLKKGTIYDRNLVAQWKLTDYKITYVLNGGTNNAANPATFTKEQSVTLLAPSREGYTFVRWKEGNTIPVGTMTDRTFTAEWKVVTYRITYVLNGGTQQGNPTTYTIEDTITLTNPERSGYVGSWANGGVIPQGTTGDLTIEANWITIYLHDGATITGLTADGERFSELLIPATIDGIAITRIDDTAFTYNKAITSVTIEDGLFVIGKFAFSGCTSLQKVTFGASITNLEEGAFKGCTSLSSVTFEGNTQIFGKNAFYGCTLTSIVYGGTLSEWVSLDHNSSYFRHAEGTLTIDGQAITTFLIIPEGITRISSYSFTHLSELCWISLPASCTEVGTNAFDGCNAITVISFAGSLENWAAIDQYASGLYLRQAGRLIQNGAPLTDIVLNEGVTALNIYAFANCTTLKSISLPESLTRIGESVFKGCTSLETVKFSSSLIYLGDNAFEGCTSLIQVDTGESLTTIAGRTFYGCTALRTVTFGTALQSIGSSAFEGCTGLIAVYYYGTSESWKKVYVGTNNDRLSSAVFLYLS